MVGYSGSLIKDAIKVVTPLLALALDLHDASPIFSAEEPELSKFLVGKFFFPTSDVQVKISNRSLRHFLHSFCASIVSFLLRHILAYQ